MSRHTFVFFFLLVCFNSAKLSLSLFGYSAVVRTPVLSPTSDAAVPQIFEPRPSPLASWYSSGQASTPENNLPHASSEKGVDLLSPGHKAVGLLGEYPAQRTGNWMG